MINGQNDRYMMGEFTINCKTLKTENAGKCP